jgi:5'-3' exonuclease
MKAHLDADVIRYEAAFASETGWRHKTGDNDPLNFPPWDYTVENLHQRLEQIKFGCQADELLLYMTEGETFRYAIAKRKPYKSNRQKNKPFHFDNLTVYLRDVLGANVITHLEADDAIAIAQVQSGYKDVIASRDKDLRQVKGKFFSWELGKQASFSEDITAEGWIRLSPKKEKIVGTGYAFFLSQVLTGDPADTTPGLPGTGPVAAFELLQGKSPQEQLEAVQGAYMGVYGPSWKAELLEQIQLHWLVRRYNEDGTPELGQIGMVE